MKKFILPLFSVALFASCGPDFCDCANGKVTDEKEAAKCVEMLAEDMENGGKKLMECQEAAK